jgi:hypothetical protein
VYEKCYDVSGDRSLFKHTCIIMTNNEEAILDLYLVDPVYA